MIIVYTPAGGEPEAFDARKLKVSEVSIVSRTIDMRWPEIKQGLSDDDPDAMRGVVWVLKKRSHPSLRFGEFDPGIEELATRLDKDEVEDYVTKAVAVAATDPDVTGEEVAAALSGLPAVSFDPEHAERVIKEKTAEDPKDGAPQLAAEQTTSPQSSPASSPESTSSEPNTSPSSPTSSTSNPELSTS